MSLLGTAVVVLLAWIVAALVVGVVVGRAIRHRDLQVASGREPAVASGPEPVEPAVVHAEPERLFAALDRAGGAGNAEEIADLLRIWTARSAADSAEQELNRAIEAARRNGHTWVAIRTVLELPLPGTLESSPDQT
jgi:hypothetical protein